MPDPFENYSRDITKTDEANAKPSDFTRRKIPCVSMGRVVNTEAEVVPGRPLSES